MSRREGAGALDLGGLTPLLDTVFLLLFALLTLSRNAEVTELVRVELPVVDPEGDAEPGGGERIVLIIDAESNVRLAPMAADEAAQPGADTDAGVPIDTRADLDEALGVLLSGPLGGALPEEVTVEIQADADARQGVAVQVLQHLRLAGFSRVELVAIGVGAGDDAFGASSAATSADGGAR